MIKIKVIHYKIKNYEKSITINNINIYENFFNNKKNE